MRKGCRDPVKTRGKPKKSREKRKTVSLTTLTAQEVGDEVLHQAVLLRHPALEADHLDKDLFVIPLEITYSRSQILAFFFQACNLRRQAGVGR